MSTRSIAVLLGLVVVIAGLTLFQDFQFDALIARERTAAVAVDHEIDSISRAIAEVRAAQAGYVATGQAPATWMTRATEAFGRLVTAVDVRKSSAAGPQAKA